MIKSFSLRIAFFLAAVLFAAGRGQAFADDCVALGGAIVSGECRITSLVTKSGSFTLDETLHILSNGRITVPAASGGNALTLNIAGDLVIDTPASAVLGRISGDVSGATAVGATITVNAAGDIRLKGSASAGGGARISATQSSVSCTTGGGGAISLTASGVFVAEQNSSISVSAKCPGGEIEIAAQDVEISGQVLSESTIGGAGTLRPGGGPISVIAGCTLLVNTTGIVRSQGSDPGADRVHIEGGCDVSIYGLVASTGQGHVPPTNPINRCHDPSRPDKPSNSTACLEIWSGDTLTIDSVAPRKGEVHADISVDGGGIGHAWLELFAKGDITIVGDTAGEYAVHSNATIAQATAGSITIQSAEGAIVASNRAVQANSTTSGGQGGAIVIEAGGDPDGNVDLGNASIQARGASSGTGRQGGTIDVRSFNGQILGVAGGQLSATGPPAGSITLTACGAVAYNGAVSPASGNTSGVCGGTPDVPGYVTLPLCLCRQLPLPPRIRVEKTGNGTITAGDTAKFTITVTNDGPGEALDVSLSDPLPAGLTWVENPDNPACTINGTTLGCTIGTLAEAGTFTVTVEAQTTTLNCGALPNTATVSASNEDPASTSDNTASATVTVSCPDVQIAKQGNGTVVAGGTASFTMTVTNLGPGAAKGVTLSDTLPPGLTWTENPDTLCTITGNTLNCNIGTLAPNATFPVTVQATVTTSACGSLPNTATVSATNENPSSTENNSASATVTVNCPDLQIAKVGNGTITVGGQASFTMTVTNLGPGSATGVVLNDTLPAGLTWTESPDTLCTISGGNSLTCNIGTLPPNGTFPVTVVATTTNSACGSLPNTATVSGTNENPTANGNNSASASVTVNCPDLQIAKVGNGTISAGGQASFTMTVTNLGPGSATGVVLNDTLPAGLTWTESPDTLCTISGGNSLTCNIGTLAPNGTFPVTVVATTSVSSCGSLPNTATVSGTNENPAASGNNSASASVTVSCPDLQITKVGNGTINVGGQASFTMTVTNLGPGSATGVVLNDTLPAGLTWTESPDTLCTITGGKTLACNIGTLPPNGTFPVTVVATTTVNTCGALPNTATVSGTNEAPGLTSNNSASATVNVQCPDLQITKEGNGTVTAGGQASFTMTVTNLGPGSATGVVLNDTLPAGLTWTESPDTLCTISGGNTLACNVGTLAQNASFAVTVVATTTASTCGALPNTATVSGTNEGAGLTSNNSASATVTVQCTDLKITKVGNGTISAGSQASFTMTVTNLGPGTATGVVLNDTLPAGLTWTESPDTLCTITGGNTLACNIGTLAPNGTFPVTVVATTTTSSCGSLPNTATVSGTNESAGLTANNSASATVTVQCPDLQITKEGNGTITAGGQASFTMTVTNLGPGSATGVVLNDTLPAGLTWTESPNTLCTISGGNTLACNIGTLAQSASFAVTVVATTTTSSCGSLPNTATVSGTNEAPGLTSNNSASATVTVQCPDLKITKVGNGTITAGGQASFTMTVTNLGPGSATGVVLNDSLPAGLTWTESPDTSCTITGGTTLACNIGTLAANATFAVTVVATTTTSSCGSLPNTATVSGTNEAPGLTSNNSASATVTVQCPDLKITKVGNGTISAGGQASFTMTVTNLGPGSATGVVLNDTLPAGLTWTESPDTSCTITGGNTLACNIGTLAANGTFAVTVVATTTASTCGSLPNTATVSGTNEAPGLTSNNSASATVTVQCTDLKITKVGNGTINVGGQASFTMTVTNLGPGSATGVVLNDTLPAGLTWTESPNTLCTISGGTTLACNIGTLAANATFAVTVVATTSTNSCGALPNTATVSGTNESAGLTANNSASATVVVQCPDLKITKTAYDSTIDKGEYAKFTMTVTNLGPGSATGVVMTDTLPSGLTWVEFPDTLCTISSGKNLTCNIGTLASGGTFSVTVKAVTGTSNCGVLNNTAYVSGANEHPALLANNSASASITVACPLVCQTTVFSGDTSESGTAGNTRTFTVNGVSVKVTAFSRDTSGNWASAYLGLFSPGFGVTDGSENGANGTHRVDNIGRNNYVLFEFASPIVIDQAYLNSVVTDSDMSVWIGTFTDPYNNHLTLSDAVLNNFTLNEDSFASDSNARFASFNSGKITGNAVVIAAYDNTSSPNDQFKLNKLRSCK